MFDPFKSESPPHACCHHHHILHHHDPVDPAHDEQGMVSVRGLLTIWGRVAASGGFGAPHDLHPPSTPATSSCFTYKQLFQLRAAGNWDCDSCFKQLPLSPLSLICLCSWLTYSTETYSKVVMYLQAREFPSPLRTTMPIACAALKYILLSSAHVSSIDLY